MIYKFINKILFFIVVIFLPLTILLSCVNIVTYDINHYMIDLILLKKLVLVRMSF